MEDKLMLKLLVPFKSLFIVKLIESFDKAVKFANSIMCNIIVKIVDESTLCNLCNEIIVAICVMF